MKRMLIVIMALVMYSCDKSHYYTFADKELLADYYPYKGGESVSFVNELSDTITYSVDKISDSLFLCDSEYDGLSTASYRYVLNSHTEGRIEMCVESVSAELDAGTNIFKVEFYQNGECSSFYKKIYGDENSCRDKLEDTVFYEHNVDNNIKDLIHVRNKGILSFYDSSNDSRWILINE